MIIKTYSRLLFVIFLILTLMLVGSSTVNAQSGWLNNVSAVLNDTTVGANAELSVSFTLPINAYPILHTDYIQIFPSVFQVTSPPTVLGGGYAGTPIFSVVGNYVKITDIAVAPGNQVIIYGIGVKNPTVEGWWPVTIAITQDEAGTIIKNRANVDATKNPGTVTVSASIDTPYSRVSISGFTAPETFVTFTEYGSVIGTDVSGLDGHFGKIFPSLVPGNHQFTFYGIDKAHLVTTPITFSLYTPAFQETSITNQILSPTITINKSSYSPTESIIANGSTVPNGDITLFTQSPLRSYSTTADDNGNWTYAITNTNEYVPGDYHIYSLVQDSGLTSLNSPSIGFSITSSGNTGTACGDVFQGDLNCDTNIDLTDFSILMYYWGTNNAIADVNSDSVVNLTDFSIMMYWWGT